MTNEPPFPVSEIASRAQGKAISYLMQQGLENRDCLSLAAGFVDPVTLPVKLVNAAAKRVLQERGPIGLQYGSTMGADDLRTIFRRFLGDLEGDDSPLHEVPLQRISLTTGSQQLLNLVSQALFNPGDICLVAAPTYFAYLGVLETLDVEIIPVNTDEHGMCPKALHICLEQLSKAVKLKKVKLVYVVSDFDNPSGVSVSTKRRPELVNVVRHWRKQQPLFLLEDAAYRELSFNGHVRPSMWSFDARESENESDRCVILSQTFSKSFSPGLRVGLGVLPSSLVSAVNDLKGNDDFGSNHFSQNIVADVLQSNAYRDHVASLRSSYQAKCDAMLQAADRYFSKLEGVTWHRPEGGLYVWMTLPTEVETDFQSPLFQTATRDEKVMYVPGQLCYPETMDHRPNNQMRLSYGVLNEEQIDEAMQRLARAVTHVLREQLSPA